MDLILDTSVLFNRPGVLSLGGDAVRFLIPDAVSYELSRGRFAKTFSDLLQSAEVTGRLVRLPRPAAAPADVSRLARLGLNDALILQTAIEYQRDNPNAQVFLVSDDMELVMEAGKAGVQYATSKTIEQLIATAPAGGAVSKDVSDAADSVNRANRNYLVQGFVLGVAACVLLSVVWYYRRFVGETFPVWGLALGAMFIGTFLFWFRSRLRLPYGIVETFVGVFAAAQLANPSAYNSAFFFQLSAGLYIIVRGLDNVEKGIEGTKIEPMWKRFFRRRDPPPA